MRIKVNGREKNIEIENEKALLSSTLELLGYRPNTIVYIFNIPIVYNGLLLGLFATFLIYPILAKILSWIDNIVQAGINDKKKQ